MQVQRLQSRPFGRTAPTQPSRRVVVQVKPTKAADFRGLDNGEILEKIAALKKEYVKLKFYQRTRGADLDPSKGAPQDPDPEKTPKGYEFKHARRQVAQLWTVLRERMAADNLKHRQVKKLKKEFFNEEGFGRYN